MEEKKKTAYISHIHYSKHPQKKKKRRECTNKVTNFPSIKLITWKQLTQEWQQQQQLMGMEVKNKKKKTFNLVEKKKE